MEEGEGGEEGEEEVVEGRRSRLSNCCRRLSRAGT